MSKTTDLSKFKKAKTLETVKFDKPIVFEDKEYTELNFDFEGLKGSDIIDAVAEARALKDATPVIELSKTYQAIVAAKAANIPIDLLMVLPARKFTTITVAAQNFLLE